MAKKEAQPDGLTLGVNHADEIVPISAMKLDPKNRRDHSSERGRRMIRTSLKKFGAARSITIDENRLVLAGNGVTGEAPEAGIGSVRIVKAKRGELIAVQIEGLTDEEKRSYAVADNRTSEMSAWDKGGLREDALDGSGVLDPWFSPEEQQSLTLPASSIETVDVTRDPPEIAWVMVAVPLDKYHLAADAIVVLEGISECTVRTTRDKAKEKK